MGQKGETRHRVKSQKKAGEGINQGVCHSPVLWNKLKKKKGKKPGVGHIFTLSETFRLTAKANHPSRRMRLSNASKGYGAPQGGQIQREKNLSKIESLRKGEQRGDH